MIANPDPSSVPLPVDVVSLVQDLPTADDGSTLVSLPVQVDSFGRLDHVVILVVNTSGCCGHWLVLANQREDQGVGPTLTSNDSCFQFKFTQKVGDDYEFKSKTCFEKYVYVLIIFTSGETNKEEMFIQKLNGCENTWTSVL